MKKCSYCGKEYADEVLICPVDLQPVIDVVPSQSPPPSEPSDSITKQLTYVAPLQAGLVLALLYGALSLILVPFFIIMAVIGAKERGTTAGLGTIMFAILFPIFYAIAGFIGGMIMAALYNLIAKLTGGLEFEVKDVRRD